MSERRSPWTGLTGSETLELQDELLHPSRHGMTEDQRAADVATMYALRCVRALIGNDLREALRAAQISHAASGLVRERQRAAEFVGQAHAVVHQDPATGRGQGPRAALAHRPDGPGVVRAVGS